LVRVTIALLPLRYALLIRSNGTESILEFIPIKL
jgi:hypothetical protein